MTATRGRRAGWACASVALGLAVACGGGCRAGATRASILYADALERLALQDSLGAFTLLQDAAYSDPDDARVRFLLGQLYARRGTIEGRAHAETELRAAVELAPENGLYAAELGAVLHRQGFNAEARASLRRAVRLDPTLARAWYVLGLELGGDLREEPQSRALRDSTAFCFERALDADSTIADARWRLAVLLLERGEPERARAVARQGIRDPACPGLWGMLLATIEFRSQRRHAAAAILDSTLACVSRAERDSFVVPWRIQPPDSTFCPECTPAEFDSTLVAYWWALDPTPATPLNERLLENVVRTVEADFWFEVPRRVAGRNTDRGEIYLRYGQPEQMWKDITENRRTWFWSYTVAPRITFIFQDLYQNHMYVRLRDTVGGDFWDTTVRSKAPERGLTFFGPPAPGWQHVVRLFRTDPEHTAVELAYGFVAGQPPDSLRVDVAVWRGPGRRVGRRSLLVPRGDLYRVDRDHFVGRVRLEVPSERLELGLQVVAIGSVAEVPPVAGTLWAAMVRDTVDTEPQIEGTIAISDLLLAHELGPSGAGGPFDLDGRRIVPRVDAEIRGGRMHLYFEIYAGDREAKSRPTLYVTYRVQAEPPARWRFRDQFSSDARARRARRTAVESTFMLEPRDAIEKQELSIDVASLAPGEYSLTVEVQPRGEPARASRTLRFSIPEPRQSENP